MHIDSCDSYGLLSNTMVPFILIWCNVNRPLAFTSNAFTSGRKTQSIFIAQKAIEVHHKGRKRSSKISKRFDKS